MKTETMRWQYVQSYGRKGSRCQLESELHSGLMDGDLHGMNGGEHLMETQISVASHLAYWTEMGMGVEMGYWSERMNDKKMT